MHKILPRKITSLRQELETWRVAETTRQLIGQATGLIATGWRLTTEDAWRAPEEASSLANTKVRVIARILVDRTAIRSVADNRAARVFATQSSSPTN